MEISLELAKRILLLLKEHESCDVLEGVLLPREVEHDYKTGQFNSEYYELEKLIDEQK